MMGLAGSTHPTRVRRGYRWELLVFCWVAYFLNRADRQIYSAVLPSLQPDLALSDAAAGFVATCFTWTYGVLVPLAGWLGDRWRRKWIFVLSLLVWSAATLLTGLAGGLIALIIFRGLATGGGEAFYYPAANSLIGQFHERTRAVAMSIHQTSVYVGVVAGGWLAGLVADYYQNWRSSFFLFGVFGVGLAILAAWRIDDTPQPASSAERDSAGELVESLRLFAQRPTLLLLTLAFAGQIFVESGYLLWMPTFLKEEFGQSQAQAGFSSTFYHFALAFPGVLLAGAISDRLVGRYAGVRMMTGVVGMIVAAPFIYLMAQAHAEWVCYLGLAGFGLFRGFYDSNLFAAPFDVIPVRLRSSVVGLMLCGAFLVGATSPLVLGRMKEPLGLRAGLVVLAVVYGASGIVIGIARFAFFNRDLQANRSEEPAV